MENLQVPSEEPEQPKKNKGGNTAINRKNIGCLCPVEKRKRGKYHVAVQGTDAAKLLPCGRALLKAHNMQVCTCQG